MNDPQPIDAPLPPRVMEQAKTEPPAPHPTNLGIQPHEQPTNSATQSRWLRSGQTQFDPAVERKVGRLDLALRRADESLGLALKLGLFLPLGLLVLATPFMVVAFIVGLQSDLVAGIFDFIIGPNSFLLTIGPLLTALWWVIIPALVLASFALSGYAYLTANSYLRQQPASQSAIKVAQESRRKLLTIVPLLLLLGFLATLVRWNETFERLGSDSLQLLITVVLLISGLTLLGRRIMKATADTPVDNVPQDRR